MAKQASYCKKCGEKLTLQNKRLGALRDRDLCYSCVADAKFNKKYPLGQHEEIDVVRLFFKDYDKWVRINSHEVEIIDVLREPASFSTPRKYVVTYRRK